MDSGTLNIISQMVMLFAIMGIGYLCKKLKVTNQVVDKGLSSLTINVAMPALIIGSVLTAEELPTIEEIAITFFAALASLFILVGLAILITKLLRVPTGYKGAYRFMVAFGNVGFLGFPVISAIFGSDALIYASIFNLPFNLVCYTVGPVFVTEDREDAEPEKITLKTFVTPMIISCLVGIVLVIAGIRNVPFISETAELLGSMTTPCAMIVIGSQLANLPARDMIGDVRLWLMSAFRLLVNPLIIYVLFSPFISNPIILGALVVTSAMPVANVGVMFSLFYGVDTKTLSQGIFVSTILSAFTIPLLLIIM